MSRHFEKKVKSNSHWSVTITSETANLDQSECRKINSHPEIYTKRRYFLRCFCKSSLLLLHALAKNSANLILRCHFYKGEIWVLHCNVLQCGFYKVSSDVVYYCNCDAFSMLFYKGTSYLLYVFVRKGDT